MIGKGKVLVVDDEDSPRRVLKLELVNEGYNVQTVADGDEAISVVEKESFDLVILDVKMPRVNGFKVLKYIKENHRATRVIMMTSYADLKSAVESERLGAEGYMTKPYELATMLATVERVLKEPPKGRLADKSN